VRSFSERTTTPQLRWFKAEAADILRFNGRSTREPSGSELRYCSSISIPPTKPASRLYRAAVISPPMNPMIP